MRDFFSLEGPFNRYGSYVADVVILSLMWIVFSLPIVTAGAATSALFYVTTRRIAGREGYITSDFWTGFKSSFKRATILWMIIFVFVVLAGFNLLNLDIVGGMVNIILPAQVILLAQIALISVFLFPATARFDMGLVQTIKSSFYMANRHLLTSITCVILMAALIAASIFVHGLILFLIPGVYAMLSSYLIMRIFKRYRPEMDKDPVLEIQEIEAQKAEERRKRDISIIEVEIESNDAITDDPTDKALHE